MAPVWMLLVMVSLEICTAQVTKVENRLLSRKRRYLAFPDGSNFVVTMSGVKSVMVQAPKGINVLGECDVPFRLPSDARLFRRRKRPHARQRRQIFNQLAGALDGHGFNGTSCVKRMICEAREFFPIKQQPSLVKDLLSAIFKDVEEVGREYFNYCHNATFAECDVSFLNYIMGSFGVAGR